MDDMKDDEFDDDFDEGVLQVMNDLM